MKSRILILIGLILSATTNLNAYDLIFDNSNHVTQWIFNGSYIYARTTADIAELLPRKLLNSIYQERIPRKGLWVTKYTGRGTENYLRLYYRMNHHLMYQGLVQFIATPTVPITVTTTDDKLVGKYWSDGKMWCDAIFDFRQNTQIRFDIETPNPGNVLIIDKIILSAMANLTQTVGREIHPCLTSPPSMEEFEEEEETLPDMIPKPPRPPGIWHPGVSTPEILPDMAEKPPRHGHSHSDHHTHRHEITTTTTTTPKPRQDGAIDTTTTNSDEQTVSGSSNDASEVKCGCSCSCARVKSKKNATTTIAPSG